MGRIFNSQLERLRTDRINYYLVQTLIGAHWDKLENLDVLSLFDKAKADGRITNASFSFHESIEDFKRIVDAYPRTFSQIQYS